MITTVRLINIHSYNLLFILHRSFYPPCPSPYHCLVTTNLFFVPVNLGFWFLCF